MMRKSVVLLSLILIVSEISGLPPRNIFERISGGGNATKGTMPYIVSIQTSPGTSTCVGTILNSEWILTSGTCSIANIRDIEVVAGEHVLSVNEGTEQRRRIHKLIIHPDYTILHGDLAMYKMAPPLEWTEWVQPVQLDLRTEEPSGFAVTAGWGFKIDFPDYKDDADNNDDGGGVESLCPDILQILKGIELISNEECQNEWGNDGSVDEKMLCSAYQAQMGPCIFDNGAPLMCMDNSKNWAQCGIVIMASCGACHPPTIYTRVSSYAEFINHIIETDGECTGFECQDGQCIPLHYQCDGWVHCVNDEIDCDNSSKNIQNNNKYSDRKTFAELLSEKALDYYYC